MITKNILDYNFTSASDLELIIDHIFQPCPEGKNPVVATLNVDQIVKFSKMTDLKRFIQESYLILPDGQPVVWASRLLHKPLRRRITGSDLFPLFWERSIELRAKVLCITPNRDVAVLLSNSHPTSTFYTPSFFSLDDESEIQNITCEISSIIERESIEFVVVGLSLPKREILARNLISRLSNSAPKFLLFGAAFEFYLGTKKRAPALIQKCGLEWLHRFSQEPTRLFKRYFIESIPFFGLVLISLLHKDKS